MGLFCSVIMKIVLTLHSNEISVKQGMKTKNCFYPFSSIQCEKTDGILKHPM